MVIIGCTDTNTDIPQKSSNTLLKNISVDNGVLNPPFNSSINNYELYFSFLSNINTVTIIGEKEDEKASVTGPITIDNLIPGVVKNVVITVTAENGMTKNYNIKVEHGGGDKANFSYELSLITEKITIQNNNLYDPIFIWASTNDIVYSNLGVVCDAKKMVLPGNIIEIDAAIGLGDYRPNIIYTLLNGITYKYTPKNPGNASAHTHEILILDFEDSYTGDIPEFREMFSIDTSEAGEMHYGNTLDFSWIDRRNGKYLISPSINRESVEGYVGNIEGTKSNGDKVWLPGVYYFITEKYSVWNNMWNN
jgi:hypothetical protein